MWDSFSDLALLPFSIPVLVLQAAHPDIGAAVARYSVYKEEPWGRFFRTAFSLMRFLYGGKQSRDEAKDLRRLHAKIKGVRPDGTEYFALRPETFRVVPDTFLAAVLRFREELGDPLTPAAQDQLFEEYLQLCLLFRIPRRALPASLADFQQQFDQLLLETMTYNETVAFLLEDMMEEGPRIPLLSRPWQWIYRRALFPVIRLFTLGFLDARFRAKHGIDWSDRDESNYRRGVKVVAFVRKYLPRFLRYSPFALWIMAGGHGPKVVTWERLREAARD